MRSWIGICESLIVLAAASPAWAGFYVFAEGGGLIGSVQPKQNVYNEGRERVEHRSLMAYGAGGALEAGWTLFDDRLELGLRLAEQAIRATPDADFNTNPSAALEVRWMLHPLERLRVGIGISAGPEWWLGDGYMRYARGSSDDGPHGAIISPDVRLFVPVGLVRFHVGVQAQVHLARIDDKAVAAITPELCAGVGLAF